MKKEATVWDGTHFTRVVGCHGSPKITKEIYPKPMWKIQCEKCGRTIMGDYIGTVSALWNSTIWSEKKA